jgi:6-phosphofructokinase 2
MKSVVTLTLNPAIDGSSDALKVRPIHKIRTANQRYDPGGGGINVARVVQRMGGKVRAIYLAGGATGGVLDNLLDRDGIDRLRIDIADHTRISQAVHETETGLEYRFVPEGPVVAEDEWRGCLNTIAMLKCDYLVISGSLPRGVPTDFYVTIIEAAHKRGARIILDTSGAALRETLKGGHIFLAKPSLGELESIAGHALPDFDARAAFARSLVQSGQADHVAVTLGHLGAMLVSAATTLRLPAIEVEVRSAVGAGDSFLGAMTYALAAGQSVEDAFRLGVAAGTAAVLTPGTDLCHKADVERMLEKIGVTDIVKV